MIRQQKPRFSPVSPRLARVAMKLSCGASTAAGSRTRVSRPPPRAHRRPRTRGAASPTRRLISTTAVVAMHPAAARWTSQTRNWQTTVGWMSATWTAGARGHRGRAPAATPPCRRRGRRPAALRPRQCPCRRPTHACPHRRAAQIRRRAATTAAASSMTQTWRPSIPAAPSTVASTSGVSMVHARGHRGRAPAATPRSHRRRPRAPQLRAHHVAPAAQMCQPPGITADAGMVTATRATGRVRAAATMTGSPMAAAPGPLGRRATHPLTSKGRSRLRARRPTLALTTAARSVASSRC